MACALLTDARKFAVTEPENVNPAKGRVAQIPIVTNEDPVIETLVETAPVPLVILPKRAVPEELGVVMNTPINDEEG